jgi:hypothetical protein
MKIPEWLEPIIETFEGRTDPFMEVSVADAMRAARKKQGTLSKPDWRAFLAEHSAFLFMERLGNRSGCTSGTDSPLNKQ